MIETETLLYTSLVRADLLTWQERAFAANVGKACLRVDTWELRDQPSPGGETFTLYACTIVLETVSKITGEARRSALRSA